MTTEEVSTKFIKKISSLSDEAQFYFENNSATEDVKRVAEMNNVDFNVAYDAMITAVAEDFNFDKVEAGFPLGLFLTPDAQTKFMRDLIGIIFCPLIDFLPGVDIAGVFNKRGGKLVDYQEHIDAFNEILEDEVLRLLEEAVEKRHKEVNKVEEVEAAVNIFSTGVKDLLLEKTNGPILDLNNGLIFILMNVPDFQDKLSGVLLNNQEILTNNNLDIEGRQNSPTIANWLRDFIKHNGSGIFDNIALSTFITNSRNAARLSPDKKELLRRLLLLYRNLKYFPESMGDQSPEFWEIVPIDKEEVPIVKTKLPSKQSYESNKERIVFSELKIPKSTSRYVPQTKRNTIVTMPIVSQDIQELTNLLQEYPVGSIERKSIEEEIRKRKQ